MLLNLSLILCFGSVPPAQLLRRTVSPTATKHLSRLYIVTSGLRNQRWVFFVGEEDSSSSPDIQGPPGPGFLSRVPFRKLTKQESSTVTHIVPQWLLCCLGFRQCCSPAQNACPRPLHVWVLSPRCFSGSAQALTSPPQTKASNSFHALIYLASRQHSTPLSSLAPSSL